MRKFLVISFAFVSSSLFAQPRIMDTIDLKFAIDSGFVETVIEGYYGKSEYQSIDGGGGYYGQCITMSLRPLVDSMFIVNCPVGSILKCRDTTVQDMIVTKSFYTTMFPEVNRKLLIYAMCGEISDRGPAAGIFYDHGGLAESDVITMASYNEKEYLQDRIGQYCIWSIRNHADSSKLISYGASYKDLKMVAEHIRRAGLSAVLLDQIPLVEEVVENVTNVPNEAAKEQLYGEYAINRLAIILMIICGTMLIFTTLLMLRRKN